MCDINTHIETPHSDDDVPDLECVNDVPEAISDLPFNKAITFAIIYHLVDIEVEQFYELKDTEWECISNLKKMLKSLMNKIDFLAKESYTPVSNMWRNTLKLSLLNKKFSEMSTAEFLCLVEKYVTELTNFSTNWFSEMSTAEFLSLV